MTNENPVPALSLPMTTERLRLREFARTDAPAVHVWAVDAEVVRYLIWGPNSRQETEAFLDRVIAEAEQRPRATYSLVVERHTDGQPIGAIRLGQSGREASIGYVYRRDAWGQGYASEAARALIGAGFSRLGLHRIWATCLPENIGSARVLEKAGMTREGHLRRHVWQKGAWRDSLLYAVLEDEWPA